MTNNTAAGIKTSQQRLHRLCRSGKHVSLTHYAPASAGATRLHLLGWALQKAAVQGSKIASKSPAIQKFISTAATAELHASFWICITPLTEVCQ